MSISLSTSLAAALQVEEEQGRGGCEGATGMEELSLDLITRILMRNRRRKEETQMMVSNHPAIFKWN